MKYLYIATSLLSAVYLFGVFDGKITDPLDIISFVVSLISFVVACVVYTQTRKSAIEASKALDEAISGRMSA